MNTSQSSLFKRFSPGFVTRYQAGSWATILASILICVMVSWLHFRQIQLLNQTTDAIGNMHVARVDLAKGFLYVTLSNAPASPFSREEGLVLLQQAADSLERVTDSLDVVFTAENLAEFQHSLDIFRMRLADYRAATSSLPAQEAALRIAFHNLENQASAIDTQSHEQLARLKMRFDLQFGLVLGGAALLLAGISTVLVLAEKARKEADEALAKSEARYRLIAENSADVIWVMDPLTGKFTYVSPSVQKLRGYTPEEVLAQPVVEALTPDSLQKVSEGLARNLPAFMARGSGIESYVDEVDQPCKDGSIVQTEVTTTYLFNERGQVEIVGVSRNITERKQADKERAQLVERLDLATRSAHMGIWDWNIVKNEIVWDDQMYALYGLKPGEFGGAYEAWLHGVHPDDRQDSNEVSAAAVRGEQKYDTEFRVVWPDGSVHWLKADGQVFCDESGKPLRMVGVNYDITERKRMEDELRRSNAELEQFAYIASHDLQEPLRTVAGMVQLLQQRYRGKLDERADEYIRFAVDAADRMQQLINDLLDFSRVERKGKLFNATNMDKVLHTALTNLHTAIAESGAKVTHGPLPTVMADSGQLTQVLQNLVGNAIKFHGEQPPEVHIRAEKVENAWQFSVSDNGIGIDSQYFERVFLIFQRLHTRSKYPGTGIGLALCKKIIERHGGRVWIESELGQGATFFFTLPERSRHEP